MAGVFNIPRNFHLSDINRGTELVHGLAALDGNDNDMQELAQLEQMRIESDIASHSEDPLYINCPLRGTQLCSEPSILAGRMTTGEGLPLPIKKGAAGMAITGLPGCGKSTLAMFIVVQFVLAGAEVIVWDLKRTWRRLLNLPLLAGKVVVFSVGDLIWSLLQPPPNTTVREWVNRFTKVLSQTYSRISAQRVLREIIDRLLAVCPPGCWPSLDMLIARFKMLRPKSSREREYVASILWVLTDLKNHFPGSFEYLSSDFPEKLFGQCGHLIVIEDQGIPLSHWNFAISLSQEWAFAYRRNNPNGENHIIIEVLEDSTSLFDSARDRETPGGVSLLAQHLGIEREMDLGLIAISHSIDISPKILHSLETVFVCSLRGDNFRTAQQVLGITPIQADFMRANPKGTAIALVPSAWPRPVLVTFPPILEGLK